MTIMSTRIFLYQKRYLSQTANITKGIAGSDDAALMNTHKLVRHMFASLTTIAVMMFVMAQPIQAYTSLSSLTEVQLQDKDFGDPSLLKIVSTNEQATLQLSIFYQFPVAPEDYKGISTGFSRRHPGEDIRAKLGAQIRAIQTGVVEEASYEVGGYGHYVIVAHENGIKSLYAHMTRSKVKKGDVITLDTIIGFVGSTGRSTGPHIHFEIRAGDAYMKPASVLPKTSALALMK